MDSPQEKVTFRGSLHGMHGYALKLGLLLWCSVSFLLLIRSRVQFCYIQIYMYYSI